MDELVKKSEAKPCPYATPIPKLIGLLSKVIKGYTGFKYVYALRRNIAYGLQYLEFLERCIRDLKMSGVTLALTYKAFILYGCGIIEALLHYLLIKRNLYSKIEWKESFRAKGNPKTFGDKLIRIDCHIFEKMSSPELEEISFNKMLDKAESNRLFGNDRSLYGRLNFLRILRNKVHLYLIDSNTDHDFNRFGESDLKAMANAIYSIFTSGIFRPSDEEKIYFDYLKAYIPSS
jgi:hypothetical protein